MKEKSQTNVYTWALYVVIYFIKTTLRLSHFFDPLMTFVIKRWAEFSFFYEKTGDLVAKETRNRVRRIFKTSFAQKLNAFVKNGMNNFSIV